MLLCSSYLNVKSAEKIFHNKWIKISKISLIGDIDWGMYGPMSSPVFPSSPQLHLTQQDAGNLSPPPGPILPLAGCSLQDLDKCWRHQLRPSLAGVSALPEGPGGAGPRERHPVVKGLENATWNVMTEVSPSTTSILV